MGQGFLNPYMKSWCIMNWVSKVWISNVKIPIPLVHELIKLEAGFRADLIVEDKLLIEIKSIECIAPVHYKQVTTYLKLANIKLGLLINFNVALIKDGIQRIVNNLKL